MPQLHNFTMEGGGRDVVGGLGRERQQLSAAWKGCPVRRGGREVPMNYLLLVSHGTMAPGLHSVLRMLLGDRPDVLSHSMEDGVSADEYVAALQEVLEPVDDDDALIVLGDIVGGSPLTNALNVIAERGLLANTVALGGMNLPMAIAALELLDEGVDATSVEQLLVMGKDGVRAVDLAIDDDEDEEL